MAKTIKERALVLRTCNSDMTSRNGFVWPKEGPVECPDWIASSDCGNGLHGALWGEGDGSLFNWNNGAVWQVVQVDEYIDLGGKVKFPRGIVVHTGDRLSATKYISDNGGKGAVIGGTATAGEYGTATAGDCGTATAGYRGTATAGDRGTATAGEYGTATAGDRGTATAGYRGTATAGDYGTIQIKHWDGSRYRIKTAYVGENGIKANTPYKLDGNGDFAEVKV
jgi:hypothetical protein